MNWTSEDTKGLYVACWALIGLIVAMAAAVALVSLR